MPFVFDPLVAVHPDGINFQLVDEAHYLGKTDDWVIPAGFMTDFASIPSICSWAIPKLGAYTEAAIVHDYFCSHGIRAGQISGRDADHVFRRIMREGEVDVVTRWLVFTGVRWGALFNPIRRPGWIKDAPAVLAISLVAFPVVGPPTILAGLGRLLLRAASKVGQLFA